MLCVLQLDCAEKERRPMTAKLSIRDIGSDRKSALQEEAAQRDVSVDELVRNSIELDLARVQTDHAQAAWVAEAKAGFATEVARLEQHGPALAVYRRLPRGGT